MKYLRVLNTTTEYNNLTSDNNNKLLVCYIRDNKSTNFHSHYEIFTSKDNDFEAFDGKLMVRKNKINV